MLSLALLVAVAVMTALWARQLRTRDATAVDLSWSLLIGGFGVAAALGGQGDAGQRLLAGGLAALWSLRLSWHLLRDRVLAHRGEDGRYAALRARLGRHAAVGFLGVYLLQAGLAAVFALPFVLLAAHDRPGLAPVQWVGLLLAGAGIAVESVADRQLAAHRRDPAGRGRTCRHGLWAWSRHPNYFGEWLCWCGIALVALPAPHGWLALLVPALLLLLVHTLSGIPFTERQALKSRGDDYRRYQQTTSAFFPWFPRRPPPAPRP